MSAVLGVALSILDLPMMVVRPSVRLLSVDDVTYKFSPAVDSLFA